MKKILTQNNYSTTLSTDITASSGNIEFNVNVAPANPRGFILVGPPENPEEMYYHNVIGTTIYVAGPNRNNPTTHSQGDAVQIYNSAALVNYFSGITSTTFYPEVIGLRTIRIWGGPYAFDGKNYTDNDLEIVVEDNTTTYIWFQYFDGTIRYSTDNTGIDDNTSVKFGRLLHTVTAALGRITSIEQNKVEQFVSYNSINLGGVNTNTPTLTLGYINTLAFGTPATGATIPFHNPGETLDEKMTIPGLVDFIKNNNLLDTAVNQYVHTQVTPAASWNITHNLQTDQIFVVVYDENSPAGFIEANTVDAFTNSCTLDFNGIAVAGRALIFGSSNASIIAGQPKIELTAGELLPEGTAVRMGISGRESGMNNSYAPVTPTTFDTVYTGKYLVQTFKALKTSLTKIQLFVQKTAAPDTTDVIVEIFATTTSVIDGHTYNVPTGAAIATGTLTAGSFTTTAGYQTITLTVPPTLTKENYYAIKITTSGAETVKVYYGADSVDYLTSAFSYVSSLAPIVGADFAYKAQAQDLANEVVGKVYPASAFELATSHFVGITLGTTASGDTARVQTLLATSLTGLSTGIPTYLSDAPGELSTTPGTVSTKIGIPTSSTSILITR